MNINGQFYDGIVGKPDLEEALEHYGVPGMRWGIRKDVKYGNGSISKKTKAKIRKKLSTASYRRTKKMLNDLEQLKSDYKGEKEYYKSKKQKSNVKTVERTLKDLNALQKEWKDQAKRNNYQYNTKETTRITRRGYKNSGIGQLIGGIPGALAVSGAEYGMHKYYTNKNKTNVSPYFDDSGIAYTTKKKKK